MSCSPAFPPLTSHFSILQDPRVERTKQHALLDIVVIAFCAVLCGAEGWEDREEFGLAKKDWLHERLGLQLEGGIPSEDTFRRLFARMDPEQFGRCFLSFSQSLHTIWQDHAPENLATLRKIALNLLRQDKKNKRGLKARSKKASWDNDYLLRILLQTSEQDKANN